MTQPARLWRKLAKVDGVHEGASIFGETDDDRAFFVNGKQVVGEIHGELEIRVTRAVISANRAWLKVDPRVELRKSSDWLTVHLNGPTDDELAVQLATLAAVAHAPSAGETVKLPPTGSDLARRRRFH